MSKKAQHPQADALSDAPPASGAAHDCAAAATTAAEAAAEVAAEVTEAAAPLPAAPPLPFRYLVGIGSSAGGLEALTQLINPLRRGLGASYIVVQHLSPTYKSMLPQLLARGAQIEVVEIESGMRPRADTLYITPPNRNVLLVNGCLELHEPSPNVQPKPSVNLLLDSLAEGYKEDAIAIILSGTGSDGASGVRAVKAVGGFTFAQDPQSARYSGMPSAAIETGCVDWVLTPAGIAAEIEQLCRSRPELPLTVALQHDESPSLRSLLQRVRAYTRMDFSGYKETTLWRRIERRMIATRAHSLESYLSHIDDNPDELERLAKDVLISVTSFFRDALAFERLAALVPRLIAHKEPGDEIRVWVAGCATGEEAYTIAMVLHQLLGPRFDQFRVQIFATDVDADAMQVARRGRYAAALVEELDPALVEKYFVAVKDCYEIIKPLREVVIFARQDLVLDPPFLRLDLISCRNVLIYLKSELQSRILSLFHYALVPGGALFLGKSESVAQQDALFSPEDKDAHLFLRRNAAQQTLSAIAQGSDLARVREAPRPGERARSRELLYLRAASAPYVPDCLILDAELQLVHVLGRAGEFLQMSSGKASLDVFVQLPRELRLEAQSLLRRADVTDALAAGRQRFVFGERPLRLVAHAYRSENRERLFVLAFEPAPPALALAPKESPRREVRDEAGPVEGAENSREELEDELIATREHLQTLVEELETSNEEMQALNEEVQSANEELQATNEELEAANEELQSTNEELLTINEELQVKSAELMRSNSDLEAVQNNVGMPLVVVDPDLKVTRFNAEAERLFRMHAGMQGTPLSWLALPRGMGPIDADVEQVLREGRPLERVLRGEGREYLLRVNLYVLPPAQVRGAIISLLDQTERLSAERSLRESEGRLQAVMNHSPTPLAIKDLSGRYEFVNPPYAAFFGRASEELIGKRDEELLDPTLAGALRTQELVALRSRCATQSEDVIHLADTPRHLRCVRFPLFDDRREIQSLCIQAADVTDERRAEEQLKLAALVLERAAEAVLVTDSKQRILTVNAAFSKITGYRVEEVLGKTPALLKSGRHDEEFYRRMWDALGTKGLWQGEIENRRKNGELFIEWLTINAIYGEQGEVTYYVAIFADISAIRESRKRLEYLALHDELTGLPNRTLFFDRLEHATARAARRKLRLSVLFIDLDNFKDINDSLGHDIGDLLLRQVTDCLQSCVRDQDTVARMGGDEFTVLLEDLQESEAEILATRIQQELSQVFVLRRHEVYATASIGIAFFPEDGSDVQTLLKSADAAMYRAKQEGRNTFRYSTEDLRRVSDERLSIQNGLRQAMEARELYVVYQAQYAIDGAQRLIGFEALMRWAHPQQGEISPARFIPIAEEAGLILPLTDWLIDEVLGQIRRWIDAGVTPPRVSVNISPLHFRVQNLGESLMRKLQEYELPPAMLGVEVTEGAMLHAPELVAGTLLQLKGLGVHVSLDDFGTGYSSLARLSRLPINTLKVDRAFVDGLDDPDSPDDIEITRTIIVMAHSLGKDVIAEGVETEAQLKCLRELGCEAVQGFLFARPQRGEDLLPLLQEHCPTPAGKRSRLPVRE